MLPLRGCNAVISGLLSTNIAPRFPESGLESKRRRLRYAQKLSILTLWSYMKTMSLESTTNDAKISFFHQKQWGEAIRRPTTLHEDLAKFFPLIERNHHFFFSRLSAVTANALVQKIKITMSILPSI